MAPISPGRVGAYVGQILAGVKPADLPERTWLNDSHHRTITLHRSQNVIRFVNVANSPWLKCIDHSDLAGDGQIGVLTGNVHLYGITKNQAAIIALFRAINRYVGNLPLMPGVFPDYPAPVMCNTDNVTELVTMRWGMPPLPKIGGPPVSNIRNTTSSTGASG